MRKIVALMLVLVSLTAIVVVTTTPHGMAQFFGVVTINADGTVDPADAPIQQIGEVYVITGDIESISVEKSNIVLDGNGHTLPGDASSLPTGVSSYDSGVVLNNVENVMVKNLIVQNVATGIFLDRTTQCIITNNTITGTHVAVPQLQVTAGIFIWGGNSNTITENQLVNNYIGIYLGYNSQQNTITRNNIINSGINGVNSWDASNNVIYYNNFIDNAMQVSANKDRVNLWDNGSVGNFWSDYNGTDADDDCIGDASHVIDVNNQDNYPLMYPWGAPAVAVFGLENSTHGDFLLNFSVNKPTQWMGYSLDAEANVTVTGNMTLNGLATGLHNITVYAIDLYGTSGASNTVTFTIEPQPFPTVTIAVVSAATVIVVSIGLLVYFRKRNH